MSWRLDGRQIVTVEDFKYIGSYINSQHVIPCRNAQAWAVVHALDDVWRAPVRKVIKMKIFRTTIEPFPDFVMRFGE